MRRRQQQTRRFSNNANLQSSQPNKRNLVNKTTTCLTCLIILLAAIQAFLGFQTQTLQQQEEQFHEEIATYGQGGSAFVPIQNLTNSIAGTGYVLPSSTLPSWIQNYVQWHQEQRAMFPGKALFEDPNAPKLLIRMCLGLCGGLNDRLGQLPWDLYLANQTGRLLLLHWHRPVSLEEFLLPRELDWRVPRDIPGFFGKPRVSREDMQISRSIKQLFEGFEQETGPEALFWESQFDAAMTRAITGEFKDVKVLRHRLLGHLDEDKLEERLKTLGETDMLHGSPTYGNIHRLFFKLNPNVQNELNDVLSTLKLRPTLTSTDYFPDAERFNLFPAYSGVHCRVRHPKATPKSVSVKGKNADYPADKTGLPWEGDMRDFAVETGTLALQCAQTLSPPVEPIYFFSDSNDLVRYLSKELNDARFLQANRTLLTNPIDSKALQVVQSSKIIARDVTLENAHIDRQKGREAPAYYATFVDLYLAIYARCVTYGIGFYAVFATRISGTTCTLLYQEESWGGSAKKQQSTPRCALSAA